MSWPPSSSGLVFREGVWTTPSIAEVSYPDDGNTKCLQVEDSSYWFAHRNQVILRIITHFPPSGMVYDIGGGNGYVCRALQKSGLSVALLEPGIGALNAVRRGVHNVIRATLHDACLSSASVPAVCLCDVLEHIEDEQGCLRELRRILTPGGRFYCTVPAHKWLWSGEDVEAGHYRRYTRESIRRALEQAGFAVEYVTHFFSYLPVPIWLLRVLPHQLSRESKVTRATKSAQHHQLPRLLQPIASMIHRLELAALEARVVLPFGSSLLCVAKAP